MRSYFTAVLSISILFGCGLGLVFPSDDHEKSVGQPMLIPLRRESVPVKRNGQVVSFKTSYSGVISVGSPVPQPFRVVFDTGSGHVVIPAATCDSAACLVHERFDISASETAVSINADGTAVPEGELCDHVDIGFGTGTITGEFVRDQVCLGHPSNYEGSEQTCFEMNVVMAVKMSTQPFKSFNFDGIVGLGLNSLALSDDFSFFDLVANSGKVQSPHFAVFLTEGDVEGEESELAVGGWNENRALHPLAWSPVALADHGYWQVKILAVRIDGQELDVCKDGTCRGVVDTGTSHLGIPSPHDREVAGLLTVDAGDMEDCRLAQTPVMEIVLESITITLNAENYMRKLPLADSINVGSATGVVLPPNERTAEQNQTMEAELGRDKAAREQAAKENNQSSGAHCRPRLMPVNLPEPIGPKLFILGEPVLHRYYTVYDWEELQVGFSLANTQRNNVHVGSQIANTQKGHALRGSALGDEDKLFLMQQSVDFSQHDEDDDQVLFVQVKICVNIRSV